MPSGKLLHGHSHGHSIAVGQIYMEYSCLVGPGPTTHQGISTLCGAGNIGM